MTRQPEDLSRRTFVKMAAGTAMAAPFIPIPSPKMKTGSKTMFTPAPTTIASIATLACPSDRTMLL